MKRIISIIKNARQAIGIARQRQNQAASIIIEDYEYYLF